ncbi:hypothetical protein CLHUN_26510 [Ruminiclostridium hungatei]|uniref:Uncharacterized protein n=1 Tax=Ruminiclostridium hungatei TaxID=48256 RepID=A0A1V4SI69_RUMHU|nr:hypothetical protein [Ruminiclostridium hungatei]OPX43504.1 hypothetical protein CLHUN_26510 [Ruminiclostridium hungatei]
MCEDMENYDKQLLECCIAMLSILLKQYKNKTIDITDFKSHTANKIRYISENINLETNFIKKKAIKNLVNECNSIHVKYHSGL